MNQAFNCPWCEKEIKKAVYPDVQSFFLSFEVGSTSDIFGPTVGGYEIEDMCTDCAWKLKAHLEGLGVKIVEVDV